MDPNKEAEIKDVLDTMGIEPVPAPAPETPPVAPVDAPAEPPVVTPPVAGEPASPPATPVAPVEPPAISGLPGEPPPAVTPPPAVPAAPQADGRDAEIEALRTQVMELSKRLTTPPPPVAQPPAAPISPATPAVLAQPPAPLGGEIQFFANEQEVDSALKDAASFNAFLNKMFGVFQERIVTESVNQTLARVPEVSMNVAQNQVTMMSTVQAWYNENKDLLPFKEFCGVIAKEITAKNPNISMGEALQETEKEVRSRLRLVKSNVIAPVTPGGAPLAQPGFTPGGGAGPGAPGPALDKTVQDIHNTIF